MSGGIYQGKVLDQLDTTDVQSQLGVPHRRHRLLPPCVATRAGGPATPQCT